jgi:hypothetical protein
MPTTDFLTYIWDKNYFWDESINLRKGPGLWTALCPKYYDYFETIQDCFSYQLINDHDNNALHQPLLISRKDMGIEDAEWIPLRDACRIQNTWSATITPKGAFFCEVAGALDMLFDGPGGWPIEPGWWKRKPQDFGDQLDWCEICGAALCNKGRPACESVDDVSPALYSMLKRAGSPKLKQGKVCVIRNDGGFIGQIMPETRNRYIADYQQRVSKFNRAIYPKSLRLYLAENDAASHITHHPCIEESVCVQDLDALSAQEIRSAEDWVLIARDTQHIHKALLTHFKDTVFNPGVFYYDDHQNWLLNVKAHSLAGHTQCSLNALFDRWPVQKKVNITRFERENTNPDIAEWVCYAKEHGLHSELLHTALHKIAKDHQTHIDF